MYVLTRDEVTTSGEHAVLRWSVLVSISVADRWAEVVCVCGATSRVHAVEVVEPLYRTLIDIACERSSCNLSLIGSGALFPR